eukprot:CAMPEP_0185738166 /NCGR_PEP_ID=MMETSP1171-20130828/32198_1 /TAXON_ID=374046 /ORGANISM="Helicotheca tamensis, Strain CCMP826" /LENGTH=507 /DNA_ID=CAMNT_0028409293 /DNA_START=119 /DNA_END=1640 /DNA_ORIENTATION=-
MTDQLVSTMKRTLASFLCSSASSSGPTSSLSTTSEPFSPPRKRIRLEHHGRNNDGDDEEMEECSYVAERKRALGAGTPPLLVSPAPVDSDALARLLQRKKRFSRFDDEEDEKIKNSNKEGKKKAKTFTGEEEEPLLLCSLPPEVIVDGILSYLCTTSDRFALQTSCKLFRHLSNSPSLLRELHLFGNKKDNNSKGSEDGDDGGNNTTTSDSGLIADLDTPDNACAKLAKYARAGNTEAIYMLGMIRSYCHGQVEQGASLLKLNSSLGCPRSLYALALILRDSRRNESRSYLSLAAQEGYLPAWQELLPAPEMKAKYGDLDAKVLRSYLDPPCLNRLLGRHYLYCRAVREVQTSHCWNPLCGRWAYKATAREPVSTTTASSAAPAASNTLGTDPVQSYDSFSESLQQVEALLYYPTGASTGSDSALSVAHSDASTSTNLQPISHTQSNNSQTMTTTSQSTSTDTPPSKLRVSRMKSVPNADVLNIVLNYAKFMTGDRGNIKWNVNIYV